MRTFLEWDYPQTGRHPEDDMRRAAALLKPVAKTAEDNGVTIAIENHGDIATPDLIALMEMIDSQSIGVCLDVGNSMMLLEDPVWTAEQLAPWAIGAHLKDMKWQPTTFGGKLVGTPLGHGHIDLDEVIPVLLNAPRLATIMLECPTEAVGSGTEVLKAEDQAVVRSIEFWRRWIEAHG